MARKPVPPALLVLFATAAAGLSAPASPAATVAWYSFNDGTAVDVTGNGHDGAFIGNPTPDDGIQGVALAFDGNDAVRVPNDPAFDTAAVGLSALLLINSLPDGPTHFVQKLGSDHGYSLTLQPDGKVRFEIFGGPGERAAVIAPYPVTLGAWTSVLGSYDGDGLSLYLDGELASTRSRPGLDFHNAASLVLARRTVAILDEVKVFDSAPPLDHVCDEALKLWHAATATCNDSVTEMTAVLGLDSPDRQHFGATLVDADKDGWSDLYVVNGGTNPDVEPTPSGTCPDVSGGSPPHEESAVNQFYLNNGDGSFTPDIAEQLGLADFWNAMRHVWGDYDNDGLLDVYSHNFLLSSLYKQVSGPDPMVFEDVSEAAGLRVCLTNGTGASWADFDSDGFLDIMLVEYDPSRPAAEHLNVVYMNNGDGTFTDITDASGIADDANNPMGIAAGDYDNDGDQDVFFTNSHEAASRLYRNEGIRPATGRPFFNDVAPQAGVAVIGEPNRGIGASWGDFNNDGWLDLLFSREGDSRLWRNDGDGTLTDVTGVGGLDLAQSDHMFWGGGFADLDNDGWLDVVLTNRLFSPAPGGPNAVFMNNRDGTWREIAGLLRVDTPLDAGLGFVPGDIDNDGDLDFVLISHELEQTNHLYRNNARGNNWIKLHLTGQASNRDAVGARIEVTAVLRPAETETTQIREVIAGTGFFTDIDRTQTFGLGKATEVTGIVIRWPSGLVQDVGPLTVNERHEVLEPGV